MAVGLMSGTSLDGVEAAAIELQDAEPRPRIRLLAHRHTGYPSELRERALAAASGAPLVAEELALLHGALGDAFAEATLAIVRELRARPTLVALHGQTVAHRPERGITLQLGDPARVAVRSGIPVVADFRSADVAAGGQGAPLVPFADHLLFADGTPRALLNVGGIANLTLLPTGSREDVVAFDTGPGNIVLDALAARAGERFDRDGARARRGRVHEAALRRALAHPYFVRRAPKSTGREDFGASVAEQLLRDAGGIDDAMATATALTARSIAGALARETPAGTGWRELVVAGGGAANPTLLQAIADAVAPLPVRPLDELGIPAIAREAVAFAILGIYRWRGEPNTLPRCTGARHATCGGAIHAP